MILANLEAIWGMSVCMIVSSLKITWEMLDNCLGAAIRDVAEEFRRKGFSVTAETAT